MTALCGGGTSSAVPGFGASVSVGIAQLAALLNNVPTPVAFALAGYLGLIAYDLNTFCTTDPPPMPDITDGDWVAALLLVDPVSHFEAIQKFTNLFANLLWPTFCQCDSGTQPTTPALPTPPADLPTVQPTALPSGPLSGTCWDFSSAFSYDDSSTVGLPVNEHFIPVTGTSITVPSEVFGVPTAQAFPIPAGANNLHGTVTQTSAPPDNTELNIGFFTSAGAHISTVAWYGSNNDTRHVSAAIPANAAFWCWAIAPGSDGFTPTVTAETIFSCGSTTQPTLTTPCCPPDPSQTAILQEVLALVRSLFQGSATPLTSFAETTVHAGLSGSGNFLVGANTIACKVAYTVPSSYGLEPGDPTTNFDVGFVTTSAVEGNYKTRRLEHSPELLYFDPLVDQIHYTLRPGVTATITELLRGP